MAKLLLAESPKLETTESQFVDHAPMETELLPQRDPVLLSDDERPQPVKKTRSHFILSKNQGRRVGSSIKLKIPDDRVDVR